MVYLWDPEDREKVIVLLMNHKKRGDKGREAGRQAGEGEVAKTLAQETRWSPEDKSRRAGRPQRGSSSGTGDPPETGHKGEQHRHRNRRDVSWGN